MGVVGGVVLTAEYGPMVDAAALEQDEFERLLAAEGRRLFAIAFAVLRDPEDAEDAVQETAVAAWRGWSNLADPGHSRAWLTTICLRQALRRRAWLRRRPSRTDSDERLAAVDRHLEADGRYLDLHRAHARLSRQQRAVVALHYEHGYTLSECAVLMGCSPGAVASHLSRALARLRKELRDD